MPEKVVANLEKAISAIEKWNESEDGASIGDAFEALTKLQRYLENNSVLIVEVGTDGLAAEIPEAMERLEDELMAFLRDKGFFSRIYDTCTGNITVTRYFCQNCGEELELGQIQLSTRELLELKEEGKLLCCKCDREHEERENKEKREHIFLVVQNIDFLKGKYFVSAVVIAKTSEEAVEKVEDKLDDDVYLDENRLNIFKIGELEKRPGDVGINLPLSGEDVLLMNVGEDYDL